MHLNALYDLRFADCGLSRLAAAQWLGISERTLIRHESASHPVISPIYRALRLRGGHLEEIGSAWRGWRMQADRLYWPGDRYGLTPGQIMAIAFDRQRLAELERKLRKARTDSAISVTEKPLTLSNQQTVNAAYYADSEAAKQPLMPLNERASIIAIAPFLKERGK